MASCSYEKIKSNVKELSLEEEKALIVAAKKGDREAKEILISYNMGLIHIFVSRFTHFNIPYDDLVQEAIIGLLCALDHYNPDLEYRFSSFMRFYILDALEKLAQTMGYDFGVPKSSQKYNQLQRGRYVYQELTIKLKRNPSIEEFALSMHINEDMSKALLNVLGGCLHLNAKIKNSEDKEMEYFLMPFEESVEDKIVSLDLANRLSNILQKLLSPKQLFVIYHYYGFAGYEKMNFSEIARYCNVKPQAVHDAYKKAINKLRHYYGIRKLACFLDNPEESEQRLKDYCDRDCSLTLKLVSHK